MLPYFPIPQAYRMAMDVQALSVDCLVEVDAHYAAELALKESLLAGDARYYAQSLPGSEQAQWEAIELLLPNMARHHPHHFALETRGSYWTFHNLLLGQATTFELGQQESLPHTPLDWLGRQVQEDLLLMDGAVPGAPLVAGQLCFGSGWCLDEKLGQSFLAIHGPVPLFAEHVGRSADLMMQRLKPGRPVGRVNWTPKADNRLDGSPRHAPYQEALRQGITPENAGQRCFLRIERQTLSRLPRTQAILFTIHTYLAPMETVAADPLRAQRLANALRDMPTQTHAYKNVEPYLAALLAFLDAKKEPGQHDQLS